MSQARGDTQKIGADDARPDPKPRKYPQLWQSYLWFHELQEMRKRHNLRISSINRGKSNLDAQFEQEMIDQLGLDVLVDPQCKAEREISVKQVMINYGQEVPVWDWCLSHKGIGESLAAQLLAQIDDINNSPTVSALWRFAGFSVVNGEAEKNQDGVKSPFNRKLKGVCYNIADQFIRQQTPHYSDIYYAEKARQREIHPKAWCVDCDVEAETYQTKKNGKQVSAYRCPNRKKGHRVKYSDAHLHNRAWRKMIKEFLKDLWITWQQLNNGSESS